MNAIYAYNKATNRYTMEWDGIDYEFEFDRNFYTIKKAWDANGKLIAKSYRGFATKLNIKASTSRAAEFLDLIMKTCQ